MLARVICLAIGYAVSYTHLTHDKSKTYDAGEY